MIGYTTKEAQGKLCPLSRTFGKDLKSGCHGDRCMFWRWVPNNVSAKHATAVRTRMKAASEDQAKAAQYVADYPDEFDLPKVTHGYCGAAGKPEKV